jgi:hypothetical protein
MFIWQRRPKVTHRRKGGRKKAALRAQYKKRKARKGK